MKRRAVILMIFLTVLFTVPAALSSCTSKPEALIAEATEEAAYEDARATAENDESIPTEESASETSGSPEEDIQENETMDKALAMTIGDTPVTVVWEDNDSVKQLFELAESEPLVIEMSMYGGFEQVGSIGTDIVRDDTRITTGPGDIVLYSGDQIVVFYGSNIWEYTKLGKITGLDEGELAGMLGSQDTVITLSVR